MKNWKKNLSDALAEKGMSKVKFARAVGVSPATVTDWGKEVDAGGIGALKAESLMKVCAVLEIDPGWLLGHDPDEKSGASQIASEKLTAGEIVRLIELYSLAYAEGRQQVLSFAAGVVETQSSAPQKSAQQK